jgi:hypothetical protein
MNLVANIPLIDVAPIDPRTGKWTEAWFLFFIQLFRRTGGDSGGDGQLTIADVLGLEDFIPQMDLASQETTRVADAIAQVRAIAASISIAPAMPESFPCVGLDSGVLASESIYAAGSFAAPVLEALVHAPMVDSSSAQATSSITVGASPFSYVATSRQAVHMTGGTVSSLSYGRGSSTLALSVVSGGQLVEMSVGDSLTVTYSAAPTMTRIPR